MSPLPDDQRRRIAEAYNRLPKNGKSQRVSSGDLQALARHFGVSRDKILKIGKGKDQSSQ